MTLLRQAVGEAPYIFVVGKGGVGKSTAAGALALELADAGIATHLISTDPAHSVADLFEQEVSGVTPCRCAPLLLLEELAAQARADAWLDHALAPVAELIERGSYLDDEDVAGFTRLALPGLDELMGLLRLTELAAGDRRVVVDTAPTGHTLRLLDAAAMYRGTARALRAMAEKAAAVGSAFARRPVRLAAEAIIDEMEAYASGFTDDVLRSAAFVVATRPGTVVAAETVRLSAALARRGLQVAATISIRSDDAQPAAGRASGVRLVVPRLRHPRGCDGLRAWRDALCADDTAGAAGAAEPGAQAGRAVGGVPAHDAPAHDAPAHDALAHDAPARDEPAREEPTHAAPRRVAPPAPRGARQWLEADAPPAPRGARQWLEADAPPRLLLFAGKGGVGKSTCAAAAALALARTRAVLLCSTDPAGSLADVFGTDVLAAGRAAPRLRVLQVDAAEQLERLRAAYRDDALAALEQLGLSQAAVLDRRVIEAVWDLAPPGIDEFAALAALLDAAESHEAVVLDTAPTGHFLRLLTLPGVALDWLRQLMRIVVKYRVAGAAGEVVEALVRTSRELRALERLIRDGSAAGVIVVTLPEPLVAAETQRLIGALADAAVPVAAVLVNRSPALHADADVSDVAAAVRLHAPALAAPPVGAAALHDFVDTWRIVA
jgi:arsenite/tail-anchored protein-transporting ATPase